MSAEPQFPILTGGHVILRDLFVRDAKTKQGYLLLEWNLRYSILDSATLLKLLLSKSTYANLVQTDYKITILPQK